MLLWLNGQIHTVTFQSGMTSQKSGGCYKCKGGTNSELKPMFWEWAQDGDVMELWPYNPFHWFRHCYTPLLTQLRRLEWKLVVCNITVLMF